VRLGGYHGGVDESPNETCSRGGPEEAQCQRVLLTQLLEKGVLGSGRGFSMGRGGEMGWI